MQVSRERGSGARGSLAGARLSPGGSLGGESKTQGAVHGDAESEEPGGCGGRRWWSRGAVAKCERCGTDPGSQVHRDPGGDASSRPGLGGSAAQRGGGTWEIGGSKLCLWLQVTLDWSVFLLSFRSLLFVEKGTGVRMFADHLLCAPRVQLLKLTLHARHWDKPM